MLEGFTPYDEETIKRYTQNGAWENLAYGEILDRTANRHPDNIAVIDERTRLTYSELRDRADRFALALIALGVRPHDRFLLQLPNRAEFVTALYGLWKMGAVPVLAVPRHGYHEISAFLSLTGAVGWILPESDGKIEFAPLIDRIRSEFSGLKNVILPEESRVVKGALSMDRLILDVDPGDYPEDALKPLRPDPNDVALLIPTGGTTGAPKMVPRTHNSLIVTNRHISEGVEPSDRLIQATPVGHAMAMQGAVNCAVYRGATLVLQAVPRPNEILETIVREKVTRVFLVPTQLEGVVNHPNLTDYDLGSVKIVGTTGAALPREVAKKAADYFTSLGAKFSGSSLGASEGLLAVGDPDAPLDEQLRTVGRNVTPGSHYKVIDGRGEERPVGRQGELAAKGPEVFTGYYQADAEENRKIFTSDGYYRTGDLAVIDERGYIRITGRIKDVIQRGGETLVPGEMEDLIRRHPHVESAAVIGMPDAKLGEKACAYVKTKPARPFSFEDMIAFLKAQGAGVLLLPERLEIVDVLPETGIGKTDKMALRRDIEEKLRLESEENGKK